MQPNAMLHPALSLLLTATLVAQSAPPPLAGTSLPPASAMPLPYDRGSAAVWQGLQKLRTRASLLTVNAHPDDEDGAMMAYEARGKGVDASLFVLTRGEGGQNVMSGDYWDQLGLVRTQELLASTGYEGIHLYFGRFADYGFSKTLEEAHKQWGHETVLRDAVRIVRILRPMVVTSSFNGNFADGHGQHQVSGEMAQEVFNAAADPNMFPEQIKEGLLPWKVQKVYARVPFARVTEKGIFDYATTRWEPVVFHNYVNITDIKTLPSVTVQIPVGDYSYVLANNYSAIAREGLAQQRSQNGGIGPALPAPQNSAYHLWATRATAAVPEKESDFFEGIDTTLPAIADYLPAAERNPWQQQLIRLATTIADAGTHFDPADPGKVVPMLAKGLEQTNKLLADLDAAKLPEEAAYNMKHELRVKQQQFQTTLAAALGISLTAFTGRPPATGPGGPSGPVGPADFSQTALPGQTVQVNLHVANMGSQEVSVHVAALNLYDGKTVNEIGEGAADLEKLAGGKVIDRPISIQVPETQPYTKPYFSRSSLEQTVYDVQNPAALGMPIEPYPLSAVIHVQYDGVTFPVTATVQTQHRYLGFGIVYEPLLIAPAISVTVSPHAGIVPMTATSFTLNVNVRSNVKGAAKGELMLNLPAGWTSSPAKATFSAMRDGDEQSISFQVTPKSVEAKAYTLTAVATYNGKQYTDGYVTTGYTGLRPYPSYRDAAYRTTGTDVKIAPGLKVAYVTGTGDEVPQTLADFGIHPTFLSPQDIAKADLSAYDVILLGIRSYAARPELRTFNNRLLEYVQQGGVVISQYQSNEYDHNFGPYPITLGGEGERVVEEDCKVTILDDKDPVLSWPNKITTADFDGWVEERGHGFLQSWDAKYTAPTEMHDTQMDPQKGGLIYARYGKGVYVYMAYAFFRQMPDGVPGSFRIMANLLSVGKNKSLK
ncbi:PIG-L family deacetylase [Terriglobus albidus]|uniref:PIG-L family deacetylase n=1 Tax=Terriglobus albidus TaxID=1592106 RepID=A0A5B9E5F7_9BACT|nr:PIG-L family deacetylase [Terriglobus albidus]QEE27482.1 PIG-L family deacetylase [Terriglobus albidus]